MPRTLTRSDGAAYTNVLRVNDDLLIAQRADQRKGTWYLHKLGRKWVRRSLNAEDVKLARSRVYEASRSRVYEAYRVWQDDPHGDWLAAIGSTRHHLAFKAVAAEWLTTQTKDRDYKADVTVLSVSALDESHAARAQHRSATEYFVGVSDPFLGVNTTARRSSRREAKWFLRLELPV